MTLRARRFSPAPELPGAPKASPLPLGRAPIGSWVDRAAAAMAFGVSRRAAGRTWWNSAHPPANPVSAAAVIAPPYRLAYSALPHSSAEAASGVRLEALRMSPSGLSETNSTAEDPSTVPAGGNRNTLEPRYGGGTSVASIPRSPTAPVSQKSSPRLDAA